MRVCLRSRIASHRNWISCYDVWSMIEIRWICWQWLPIRSGLPVDDRNALDRSPGIRSNDDCLAYKTDCDSSIEQMELIRIRIRIRE